MRNHSDDEMIILKSKQRKQKKSPKYTSIITENDEQLQLLESAKDKLRMATIERKRMTSLNAESKFKKPALNFYTSEQN